MILLTGAGAAQQTISGCQEVNQSGEYVLTQDVNPSSGGDCIQLNASDVVIDGQGHSIVAPSNGDTAVDVLGPNTNVTISKLSLQGWESGILAYSGNVQDLAIVENTIELGTSQYNDGIRTDLSQPTGDTGLVIRNNDISGYGESGRGIETRRSAGTVIEGNSVSSPVAGNESAGIETHSNGSLIVDNTVTDPGSGGIIAAGRTQDAIIRNNSVSGASEPFAAAPDAIGIGAGGRHVRNVTIRANDVRDNRNGVAIAAEGPVTIRDNTVRNNVYGVNVTNIDYPGGLTVAPASAFSVHENHFAGNSGFGVVNWNDSVLNATYNDWGADSGPSGGVTDPVTGRNATGSGDRVSTDVHFDPWLNKSIVSGEYLVSSGDTGAPGELVTLDFNLTNIGEDRAGFIVNITTEIPSAYSRDDAGGTWRPSTQEWVFLNVSSGESRTPSYNVRIPSNASLGNFTIRSEASSSATRTVVDDATATVRVISGDSLLDAIDEDDSCQIESDELLRAIDLWQTDSEVPNTGGQTISTSLLLDVTNSWSGDATLTYSPDCSA